MIDQSKRMVTQSIALWYSSLPEETSRTLTMADLYASVERIGGVDHSHARPFPKLLILDTHILTTEDYDLWHVTTSDGGHITFEEEWELIIHYGLQALLEAACDAGQADKASQPQLKMSRVA